MRHSIAIALLAALHASCVIQATAYNGKCEYTGHTTRCPSKKQVQRCVSRLTPVKDERGRWRIDVSQCFVPLVQALSDPGKQPRALEFLGVRPGCRGRKCNRHTHIDGQYRKVWATFPADRCFVNLCVFVRDARLRPGRLPSSSVCGTGEDLCNMCVYNDLEVFIDEACRSTAYDLTSCSVGTCDKKSRKCTWRNHKCDDGDPCTTDLCIMGKCVNESPSGQKGLHKCGRRCVDLKTDRRNCGTCGNRCAKGEVCCGGRCLESCKECSYDAQCRDGNPCTEDTCDLKHGLCFHEPLPGKECGGRTVCSVGVCGADGLCAQKPVNCKGDGVACTRTVCDPDKGCMHVPMDSRCDDNNRCTRDYCSSTQGCVHVPKSCDDGFSCTKDSCNRRTGKCRHKPQDSLCNDNLPCTQGYCDPKEANDLVQGTGCRLEPKDYRPDEDELLRLCNGTCVDIYSSKASCGACHKACKANEACCEGHCTVVPQGSNSCDVCGKKCKKSETCCNGRCKALATNRRHCGKCGRQCSDHEECCDGTCKSLATDERNCGECGNKCKSKESCCDGYCQALNSDEKNCGHCGQTCKDGETCCHGRCMDLRSSESSCGACGKRCKPNEQCCGGKCRDVLYAMTSCGSCSQTCKAGQYCCMGRCTVVDSNENHCGVCSNKCKRGEACCGGYCQPVLNDAKNCGACGKKCKAGETCCNGHCTSLTSDPKYCGSCGTACKAGEACCNGKCKNIRSSRSSCGGCNKSCRKGRTCCDGQCVDLRSHPHHCGKCFSYVSPFGGFCCNGRPVTPNDRNNCGDCGKKCRKAFNCCKGRCVNLLDDPAYCGHCNVVCRKGEACCGGECVDLAYDDSHCGSCGKTCPYGKSCCKGECVNALTDEHNCGSCGKQCKDTETCCNGMCLPTYNDPGHCAGCMACPKGQRCCDESCVDMLADSYNCGTCGNRCADNQICCGGKCVLGDSDKDNCGACGSKCPAGYFCCGGICKEASSDNNACGGCDPCVGNNTSCCGGACVDTLNHDYHCGKCGTKCGEHELCCQGNCVDIYNSRSHCGSCGNACGPSQCCCGTGYCEDVSDYVNTTGGPGTFSCEEACGFLIRDKACNALSGTAVGDDPHGPKHGVCHCVSDCGDGPCEAATLGNPCAFWGAKKGAPTQCCCTNMEGYAAWEVLDRVGSAEGEPLSKVGLAATLDAIKDLTQQAQLDMDANTEMATIDAEDAEDAMRMAQVAEREAAEDGTRQEEHARAFGGDILPMFEDIENGAGAGVLDGTEVDGVDGQPGGGSGAAVDARPGEDLVLGEEPPAEEAGNGPAVQGARRRALSTTLASRGLLNESQAGSSNQTVQQQGLAMAQSAGAGVGDGYPGTLSYLGGGGGGGGAAAVLQYGHMCKPCSKTSAGGLVGGPRYCEDEVPLDDADLELSMPGKSLRLGGSSSVDCWEHRLETFRRRRRAE